MWWLFACQPDGTGTVPLDDPETEPPDATGHTGRTLPPPAHSGHTGGAHSGGHTAAPVDPCTLVPPAVTGVRRVSSLQPSEEFAFDAVGNAVNATESAGVFLTDYAGSRTLLSPGGSWEYAGIRVAPDGATAALCDEAGGAIWSVDLATGSRTELLTVAGPNSVGWDAWGRLWVGANQRLLRFDPAVGGAPEVVLDLPGADLDGVTFAPDWSRVYFNEDSSGRVRYVTLDGAGDPTGDAVLLDLAGIGYWTGVELDGMTTDVCGNLYVVHTDGKLLRIHPDTTVDLLSPSNGHWTTAISFGSGLGGWGRDQLYLMDRVLGLFELDVGVEGRPEPHLP